MVPKYPQPPTLGLCWTTSSKKWNPAQAPPLLQATAPHIHIPHVVSVQSMPQDWEDWALENNFNDRPSIGSAANVPFGTNLVR